jgi:hypothetical protein
MVAHLFHLITVVVLSKSSYGDMANWSLELDEWVGLVVIMSGHSFTIGAEVCVVTDGAFVPIASYVRPAASASTQRAIAIDTAMNLCSSPEVGDGLK